MELLYSHCAGLDVHKETVVACARIVCDGKVGKEIETFGTTTEALLRLADWLRARGCTHVAMEATGVYWKPVWHILDDGGFALLPANAAHVKNVPGRKTDVADAAWLADLLAHGLIRASFVPDAATEATRTLSRTRKQLVREKASHTQRIQKTLEDGNIKLDSVISDVLGMQRPGDDRGAHRRRDRSRGAGGPRNRRLKAPPDKLRAALQGRVTRHHRFLLRLHLNQIDALDAAIAAIDQEVDAQAAPFRTAVRLLTSIPGVGALGAQVIVSEIGTRHAPLPDCRPSRVLGGPVPSQRRERRKRRSTRLRHGAPWLKTTLVQCAWAATRKKGSDLQTRFHRLRGRRGAKKAICAVAASILTAAYHMLKHGTFYQEPRPGHFDERRNESHARTLVKHLANLGYAVEIKPIAAAP